jgi:hypothetical protein
VADGRRGLQALGGETEPAEIDGKTYWAADPSRSAARSKRPVVHLLPNYDELTVAYRDHATSIDPRAAGTFGGWAAGVLGNVVTLEGRIAGSWRRVASKVGVRVVVDLAVPLSVAERDALADQAERFGRFLGLPVVLTGAA